MKSKSKYSAMVRMILTILCAVVLGSDGFGQKVVRLYDGAAPGSEEWDYKEIEFSAPYLMGQMIRNVVVPTLEIYMPNRSVASGTGVIVCPGGGNVWLSYSSEGTDVAKWLAANGITAFVLKYRTNKTPEDTGEFAQFTMEFFARILSPPEEGQPERAPVPLPSEQHLGGDDGMRALEYVREHADEFGVDPNRVGIMGFSAGAGITLHVIVNSDPGQQPDFAAPIYGGWLGESQVPEDAPPLFILAAADDPISEGCTDLYEAWRDAGKDAELHIYAKGGHGFGMAQRGMPVDRWIERFYDWLKASGF